MNFPQVLPGNSMEIYLSEEYCYKDGGYISKIVIKYFVNGWWVADCGAIVVYDYILTSILISN